MDWARPSVGPSAKATTATAKKQCERPVLRSTPWGAHPGSRASGCLSARMKKLRRRGFGCGGLGSDGRRPGCFCWRRPARSVGGSEEQRMRRGRICIRGRGSDGDLRPPAFSRALGAHIPRRHADGEHHDSRRRTAPATSAHLLARALRKSGPSEAPGKGTPRIENARA